MSKQAIVDQVAKYFQAALAAAPSENREALRTEAPGVIRSLATMATSATKSSDRKWAFTEFFSLIRGTIIRDTALQNAIANRNRRQAELILANVKKIQAATDKRTVDVKHRADLRRALRVLAAAKKVEDAA